LLLSSYGAHRDEQERAESNCTPGHSLHLGIIQGCDSNREIVRFMGRYGWDTAPVSAFPGSANAPGFGGDQDTEFSRRSGVRGG
jgi:hypothetical protein